MKISVLSGAAVGLPLAHSAAGASQSGSRIAESRLPKPFSTPFTQPRVLSRSGYDDTTDYYHITMRQFQGEIVPGLKTDMFGYEGEYPGPTIQATQGRKSVVRHVNRLPATHPTLGYTPWTSVHLHGSDSLPQFDGYASDITNPGFYKDYHYPNNQVARTLWYHDHGLHHTAENVQMGLAGLYYLFDPLERSLPIPHGEFDVPLMVADVMLNADGSILFDDHDGKGLYGDVILVNGRPWPVMRVKRRKYRFRLINCCPARSFKWSLDSGGPMTVIATDGGLTQTPQTVTSFRHGVAERYEIVVDFAKYPVGARIVLRNTPPKNTINFTNTDKAMAFEVTDEPFDPTDNEIPDQLNPDQKTMLLKESDAKRTRRVEFVRKNGLWTINGQTWDDVVASGFTRTIAEPNINDIEVWELVNESGGWHHPSHLHLVDFRILSRNGQPAMPHERGAKDVVYLGENETVRVLTKFDGGRGKYMIHCHNLTHEDHDMMTQFLVHDAAVPASDPLGTPALKLPEGPFPGGPF